MSSFHTARPRLTLIGSALGFVVVLLDVSVVNVALDAFHSEFSTDVAGLEWVVNAYTLIFAGLLLTAGAAVMCVSSHCEYIGWDPASSLALRHAKAELGRFGSRIRERAVEASDQMFPATSKAQAILVRVRRGNGGRSVH